MNQSDVEADTRQRAGKDATSVERSNQAPGGKTITLLAKNFGRLIFGHFLSHFGQI